MPHVGQKRSWAGDRDGAILAQLHDGVEGSTVLEGLVQKNGKAYATASLSTKISLFKSKFIETGGHLSVDCHMSSLALRKFRDTEEAVAAFFGATMEKQVEALRGDTPGWSEGAKDASKAMQLLPSNLDTFKLNEGQNMSWKRNSADELERKTSILTVVETTDRLLDEARAVLEGADSKTHKPTLIVALLIVSGRRTAEITNGHSTFAEVLGKDHHALFEGQLKQRNKAKPYTIPLLVPFKVFLHGFKTLQDMQDHAKLPNDVAKDKYQKMVADAVSEPVLKNLPHGKKKPHDLRSIYVAIVDSVFTHQFLKAGLTKRVLGHSDSNDSIHYSSVRLDPLPPTSLGELPVYG